MKWFSLKRRTKAGLGSEAPDTTTAQGGKKAGECFGQLNLSLLTHHSHGTADKGKQRSSSVEESRRVAKSDYQRKTRSSAERTLMP